MSEQQHLFEPATRALVREKARARRAAKRAHAMSLKSQGMRLDDLAGDAWREVTAAYFEVREEQPRLF
jgi:hypothetical protein